MNSITATIAFFFISHAALTQVLSVRPPSICATYSISKVITDPSNAAQTVATLKYRGTFKARGQRFVSYCEPLNLSDYPPDGVIELGGPSEFERKSMFIPTAARQSLRIVDLDSNIIRERMDFNDTGVNMMYNFEPSYQQWKLSAETKLINGLLVQKAIFINWQGVLSAEGWFYTALSIAVGPGMMVGVPGLLVEGYDFLSKRSFVLEEYDSGCTITDADFWFPEFSESFIQKVLKNRYPK